MKVNFTTDCSTVKASSFGATASNMKDNLPITESPVMESIDGLTEAFTKARWRTDSGMDLENTQLKKLPTKENGSKGKNLAKVR